MNMQKQTGSIKAIWVFGFVVVLALSVPALREAFGETRPCAEDAARLCKDVKPGGGAIAQCLKEHENELSAACKERMVQMQGKINGFRQACGDDLQKFCKDVQHGRGAVAQCLKEHETELSPSCRERVAQFKEQKNR
jgi:hypothetical protein